MRRHLTACGVVVAALVGGLAGCGSGKTNTVTVTSTAPGATVTVTVTATPSATPTVTGTLDKPLALGKTWTSPEASATVYAFNADAAPSAPPPQDSNRKWEAIDAKVCVTSEGTVSNQP